MYYGELPLKLCPFCGGNSHRLYDMGSKSWRVECDRCLAFGPVGKSRIGAVEAWNKRRITEEE